MENHIFSDSVFLTLALWSSVEFLLLGMIFRHISALERGEHWSWAEHVQKRLFRDTLAGGGGGRRLPAASTVPLLL